MKKDHRIFFAIPFDAATKNMYERIRQKIKEKYPTVITVVGHHEIGPSPILSEIASFKAQNQELNNQFVEEIKKADIVIADLTHNNANVHVELGIALTENKNILRVTGRSLTELGFDIRNLEVVAYRDENHLAKEIETYLDTFFSIKRLPISSEYSSLYYELPIKSLELKDADQPTDQHMLRMEKTYQPDFKIRDGAIRVEFELLKTRDPSDWFGVFFRAGDDPILGSYLVYVRKNGMVELADFPGPRIIARWEVRSKIGGKQLLEFEFENNYLELTIGPDSFQTTSLSRQIAGQIFPAIYDAYANVYMMQMICRDTIEWV